MNIDSLPSLIKKDDMVLYQENILKELEHSAHCMYGSYSSSVWYYLVKELEHKNICVLKDVKYLYGRMRFILPPYNVDPGDTSNSEKYEKVIEARQWILDKYPTTLSILQKPVSYNLCCLLPGV